MPVHRPENPDTARHSVKREMLDKGCLQKNILPGRAKRLVGREYCVFENGRERIKKPPCLQN